MEGSIDRLMGNVEGEEDVAVQLQLLSLPLKTIDFDGAPNSHLMDDHCDNHEEELLAPHAKKRDPPSTAWHAEGKLDGSMKGGRSKHLPRVSRPGVSAGVLTGDAR